MKTKAKKVHMTSERWDAVHEYLEQWIKQDEWCDLSVALEEGDTEMAAYMVDSSGAIDPNTCYPESSEIEVWVQEAAKRFRALSERQTNKRYDSVFRNCFVSSCLDCNSVQFLNSGNEELYPETKSQCWECKSKNIIAKMWGEK
jgi:hypothetical protein